MPRKENGTQKFSLFDREALERLFAANGIKTRHVRTVWKYLFGKDPKSAFDPQSDNVDYNEITELPKKAAELLREQFILTTSSVIETSRSTHEATEGTAATDEGSSSKLVVLLHGGKMVETVVIDHTDNRSKVGGNISEHFRS